LNEVGYPVQRRAQGRNMAELDRSTEVKRKIFTCANNGGGKEGGFNNAMEADPETYSFVQVLENLP